MEHVPADLAHHFLLAITTRPGSGICFKDRGWYSREDADDNNNNEKSGKLHNKILANILKTLKVNEDSRQQELARRILEACPELVAGCIYILFRLSSLINMIAGTGLQHN